MRQRCRRDQNQKRQEGAKGGLARARAELAAESTAAAFARWSLGAKGGGRVEGGEVGSADGVGRVERRIGDPD